MRKNYEEVTEVKLILILGKQPLILLQYLYLQGNHIKLT